MGSSTSSHASQQYQAQGNSRSGNRSNIGNSSSSSYGRNSSYSGNLNPNTSTSNRNDPIIRAASTDSQNHVGRNTASVSNGNCVISHTNNAEDPNTNARASQGLEALQDAEHLSGTGTHLFLNRPYPMLQRSETEGTAAAFTESPSFAVPSEFTTVRTFSEPSAGASGWKNAGPCSDVTSDFNGTYLPNTNTGKSGSSNSNLSKPKVMRRVHSSGGSSSTNPLTTVNHNHSINVNVSHNFNSATARRVTSQSRVSGINVITSETKLPALYQPSTSSIVGNVDPIATTKVAGGPSISNNGKTMDIRSSVPYPSTSCLNPASEVNARLDTQVEVKVYPCNNNGNTSGKKKFTQFTVKPEVSIMFVFYSGCFVYLLTLNSYHVASCNQSGCHYSRN